MHRGLKRNFQVMPGAEWLEQLRKHIPDRYEHLVRYCGWYSNRARGEPPERSPPIGHEAWPTYVRPPLTYHRVPDIA